jgi:hypothetical protein
MDFVSFYQIIWVWFCIGKLRVVPHLIREKVNHLNRTGKEEFVIFKLLFIELLK